MHAPRPFVWINLAASVDGRLAFHGGARARLSGPNDLERVHRLRAESDAILVGAGTVIADDPSLRVNWSLLGGTEGRAPTRVILDSRGRIPSTARVLDARQPTIVAVSEGCRRTFPSHVATVVAGREEVELDRLYAELSRRGIRRLLVEGGARVLASALQPGRFDRLTIYVAPTVIGEQEAPPIVRGPAARDFAGALPLRLVGLERLDDGHVASYEPASPSTGPP